MSSTICELSYWKSGISVAQVGVSSKHPQNHASSGSSCAAISSIDLFVTPFLFSKTGKVMPCPFSTRNKLIWIKIKVWNIKKTSILPRAGACLSEPIWILLHLANSVQSHPKSISGNRSSFKRWLSFSLQVPASVHRRADVKHPSFSEGLSLLPSVSWIHIHIITVPSQASFPLQSRGLGRCQGHVTRKWKCLLPLIDGPGGWGRGHVTSPGTQLWAQTWEFNSNWGELGLEEAEEFLREPLYLSQTPAFLHSHCCK